MEGPHETAGALSALPPVLQLENACNRLPVRAQRPAALPCLECRGDAPGSRGHGPQFWGVLQARGLHAAAPQQVQQQQQQKQGNEKGLAAQQEEFDEVTDKHIPQRPVSAVEATSYTFVIVGGAATPQLPLLPSCSPVSGGPHMQGLSRVLDQDGVHGLQRRASAESQPDIAEIDPQLAVAALCRMHRR